MRVPAYVMGALATIALGIFGGYASIHFSFALWMARIAIIFYALGTCLFLQDVQWERLAPGEARSFSPKIWYTSLLMMLLGLGLSFTLPYPAPLSQSPGSVAVLTPPRFREHIEEVHFSLGPIQDAAWFVRLPSAATPVGEGMPVQTGQSYSRLV
jgi:hypothetical protein